MDELLGEVYADPKQPGSFGGAEKLKLGVEKVKGIKVKGKDVQGWLTKKDTYTKFRTARSNFKRNPIIVAHIDAQWQGDLADMRNLAKYNHAVQYLLVVIDVLSKHLWVEPLKNKSGPEVLAAFGKIFEETPRRPLKLQTDDGKEFWYGGLQTFLKNNNITFFTVNSDKKAAVAERVIRTLKEKIWRYMHEKHTKTYADVLQDLVSSYNNTYHKSIKMAPSEVTEGNEGEVLKNLYGKPWIRDAGDKRKKAKFTAGDFVRISSLKKEFKKGYMGNWTEEIFIVDKVKESALPLIMYKLKDWKLEQLEGSFYEKEMQLVSKDLNGFWKVEKVLSTRGVGRRKEHYVKWEGYPDSVNSWVSDKDIKKIGK